MKQTDKTVNIWTFNICGVKKYQTSTNIDMRVDFFIDLIKKTLPDIIFIQETSECVYKKLLTHLGEKYNLYPEKYPWKNHPVDHVITSTLSREKLHDLKLHTLPSINPKIDYHCLTGRTKKLLLMNIHLQSGDKNQAARTIQEKKIMNILYSNRHNRYPVIIAGDFNQELKDNRFFLRENNFNDAWIKTNQYDHGFTQAPSLNDLRKKLKNDDRHARVDGFFYKSEEKIIPIKSHLIATQPIIKNNFKMYLSDHFGVSCTFKFLE